MRKPMIPSLLLTLIFLGSACDNAKFMGKGKKKDKNDSELVVEPPVVCQPGETCVTIDPNKCTPGTTDCPKVDPTPTPTPTTTPTPPVDECEEGEKDCPVVPPTDCDDEPGQNPGQNDGNGKICPNPNDEPGQNPGQNDGKDCDEDHDHDEDCDHDDEPGQNDPGQNK